MDDMDMNMPGMKHNDSMASNTTMDMMMKMYFHFGNTEAAVWFKFWKISTVFELILSCLIIFGVSVAFELLKLMRRVLDRQTRRREESHLLTSKLITQIRSRLTGAHLVQAILYGGQVLIGMLLMLVFMSYNVWLCAAMVTGAMVGFAFFGEVGGSTEAETCH